MPLLSVVIPTFNSSAVIGRCLRSLTEQVFRDFEVIIMDAASGDNTLDIVEELREVLPALKVFSEKDAGVYDAMNKSIAHCTGDYIYFLGSDDRLSSNGVLAKAAPLLYGQEVIYGNVRVNGATPWAMDGEIYAGPFSAEKLVKQNISHQAIFYPRTAFVLRSPAFNTNYKICGDWDFNLFLFNRVSFKYFDFVIAEFAAGGLSSRPDDKFQKEFRKRLLEYGYSVQKVTRPHMTTVLQKMKQYFK